MEQKEERLLIEWQTALDFLSTKANGTKLPYSVVWDNQTNQLKPRAKYQEYYNTYQTSASFIKIANEVYQITPKFLLGKGHFATCKTMTDKNGMTHTLKIETTNNKDQQSEYLVLQDLKLSYGKARRIDKNKYYTHMLYLGTSLDKLMPTQPSIFLCAKKPQLIDMESNIIYLYLNNNKIHCVFAIDENPIQSKTLLKSDLGADYKWLKKELNPPALEFLMLSPSEANFPYQLFAQCPKESELRSNKVALYVDNGLLIVAFRDAQDQLHQLTMEEYTFTKPYGEYEYRVCSKKPEDSDIEEKKFYIYLANGKIRYAFQSNNEVYRFWANKNEPFYAELQKKLQGFNKGIGRQLLPNPCLKTSLFNVLGLNCIELDDNTRLDFAIALCLEVANLHEGHLSSTNEAYTHNDIKPANICVDANKTLRLIDFGFTKPNPFELLNTKGSICGTPMYLPLAHHIDNTTKKVQIDLFALKRVLFMPLTSYSYNGFTTISPSMQLSNSLLTQAQLDLYQLSPYINTFSTKTDSINHLKDTTSARTLAAILITAKLGLSYSYQNLTHDGLLCKKITIIYVNHKGCPNLKERLEPYTNNSKRLSTFGLFVNTTTASSTQSITNDTHNPHGKKG